MVQMFQRFRQRLVEKSNNAGARAVTYVAFGDSITHGVMEHDVHEHTQLYHQILRRKIVERYPKTLLNVINSGVNGDTAPNSLERLERDVLQYRPDLLTIMFGANDVHAGPQQLASFKDSISKIIHLVKCETEAEILIITPPMLAKRDNPNIPEAYRGLLPGFFDSESKGYTFLYTDALHQIAQRDQVPILDVYAMFKHMEQSGLDIHVRLANGLNHPDREFHAQMAMAIENIIFTD